MMSTCCCVLDRIEGSSALELSSGPRLVLLEGGRSKGCEAPVTEALSLRQLVLFVGLAIVFAVAVCGVGVFGDARARAASDQALAGLPERTEVVQSGESLWSISSKIEVEGASTSDVVSWIVERNGLEDTCLRVGQRLVVPSVSEG